MLNTDEVSADPNTPDHVLNIFPGQNPESRIGLCESGMVPTEKLTLTFSRSYHMLSRFSQGRAPHTSQHVEESSGGPGFCVFSHVMAAA